MRKKLFHLLFLLAFLPVVSQEDFPETLSDSIVEIEAGKSVILIVSIFANNDKDASPVLARREKAELEMNFPNYSIWIIDKRCRVNFANTAGDKAIFTDEKTTFEHVIYWDGQKSSAIKTSPIRTKLTEFISSVTGKKKVSSYLANNQKIFDTIAARKKVLNPDENSKMLAQFYSLNLLYNQRLYGDIWFADLAKQDYSKVKSATVYMSRTNQPESEAFKINFNEQHLVANISYVKRPDSNNTVFFIFSYDNNGLLRKMISTDDFDRQARVHSYDYTYDGNLLVETSDEEISEVYTENGMLMEKQHYEFTDYEKTYLIETSKTVMENNCKVEYRNGLKEESYCASGFESETPYFYERIQFNDGQPARISSSKIDRKGKTLIISNKSRDDSYQPIASVKLNDLGLIESCDGGISKGITYHLRVEYKYFE